MIIEKYSICRPVKGICKQSAIWAEEGNRLSPLVYLQRPKWITSDEDWSTIVDAIRLDLPKGTRIGVKDDA